MTANEANITPTPEPCEVQGLVLHPTWCRALPSPLEGEVGTTRNRGGVGGVIRFIRYH
jgi:hypothetical protein